MFRILPLLGCWQLKADDLPKDAEGASGKRAFSLPGADSLADFADLIGDAPETGMDDKDAGMPFPLPAMLPDAVGGEAALECSIDFGALRGDHAVLTCDHLCGCGSILLGGEEIAAFDATASSYKSISDAFDLTALPCMLAVDLSAALARGRKETLTIRFDGSRPAGLCGPVMLRIAQHGHLSRVCVTPDAHQQAMTLRAQISARRAGVYLLRIQPVDAAGIGDGIREIAYRCEAGACIEANVSVAVAADRFAPGQAYAASALKITLLYKREEEGRAVVCDGVTLLCGYPGKMPQYALPLTAAECMSEPDELTKRLTALNIPCVRLPVPAPDALLREMTRAGICAKMADNIPLRPRLERLPCAAFSPERMGEYAPAALEASAWQLASMVQMPRSIDAQLTPGEFLAEAAGSSLPPEDEQVQSVLLWLRAVSVRLCAEAARQGRYAGALCAPGEWTQPDIYDSLRTAFAPLHLSAMPLYGAWWSASRFSAMIHAFIPSGAYSAGDPLIASAVLEDEEGQEIARLRAPCRHTGGHIGVLEAQLPENPCVLTLTTQLLLHDQVLEESAIPVYVGRRGPLEAAFL